MERKRRGYRAAAPGAEALAPRRHGGVRSSTSQRAAEIGLWGPLNLAQRCARVITALKLAGEDEALVQFIQPIDLAIHTAQPTAVTHDGPLRADAVFRDADPAPAVPTREMAQAYLNRLYQDIAQRAARRTTLTVGKGRLRERSTTSPGWPRGGW